MCSLPRWFSPSSLASIVVALSIATPSTQPVSARQNPAPASAANAGPPSRAEYEALAAELRRQKDLIMQMLRMEQDRYEFLLKLVGSNGAGGPAVGPGPAPTLEAAPAPVATTVGRPRRAPVVREPEPTANITGRVQVVGGSSANVYVYVENLRGPSPRGKALEIKQQGKSFVPAVSAVQSGTTVTFPNNDPVFHNVFSPSPTQPFDLGTYRSGDPAGKVTLRNPGVVEIYCNMHAKMRASVLVVPNGLYTKAGPDGKFVLRDVPVGSRRLVAWSPDAVPTLKTLDLTASGATLDLSLEVAAPAPHNNKHGQPYGSYNE